MTGLKLVQLVQIFFDVQQLAHQRMLAVAVLKKIAGPDLFNRSEHFHDQHAVMRDDGAAAFTDDVRVRHLLRVADVGDVINDVVGVFLKRVIGGAVESRTAAVVIHPQAAAHIHVLDGKPHLVQLGVKPGGLLHRFFDGQNIRHLRADVEMEQLETMAELFRRQQLGRRQQFGGAQAELGVFAAAFRPLARPLAQKPRPDADVRLHAQLLGNGDDLLELLQLFDDQDDGLAQLDAQQGHPDEFRILVAVADNQAALLVLKRQTGEQLRFAADFQAEVERLARIQNFLHHFAQLIHLDRKHAAVFALEIEFRDGALKRLVDGLDAVPQDVLKADEQRELQSAFPGLLNHIREVHRRPRVLKRFGNDMARVVDVEIFRAPARDIVERACGFNAPGRDVGVQNVHLGEFKSVEL